MTTVKPTSKQVTALEYMANSAYESLQKAIDTKEHFYAVGAQSQYAALGYCLGVATGTAGNSGFMNLARGSEASSLIDTHILEYIVGAELSHILADSTYLGNQEDESKKKFLEEIDLFKDSYSTIRQAAINIAAAKKYNIGLDLIKKIRRLSRSKQ